MSEVKTKKLTIGLSATPANNFQLDATADDGTITLKRADGTSILYITSTGTIALLQLPTSDPLVVGALWNDTGTVKVSAG